MARRPEIESLRAAFMHRVDTWLAADIDAYMACWADDLVIELPTGRIAGKDRYRKLVEAGFAWAEPVSFAVHHLAFEDADTAAATVALSDWTIRARRRTDDVVFGWRGLSVCAFHAGKITWWREHHLVPPAPVDD